MSMKRLKSKSLKLCRIFQYLGDKCIVSDIWRDTSLAETIIRCHQFGQFNYCPYQASNSCMVTIDHSYFIIKLTLIHIITIDLFAVVLYAGAAIRTKHCSTETWSKDFLANHLLNFLLLQETLPRLSPRLTVELIQKKIAAAFENWEIFSVPWRLWPVYKNAQRVSNLFVLE